MREYNRETMAKMDDSSNKQKSTLKTALTILVVALLLLLVAGIVAVVLGIYSPDSKEETEETIEEQAETDLEDEYVGDEPISQHSSSQNASVEPLVIPEDDAEIVELEYVDLFIIQNGEDGDPDYLRFDEYYVLVKNVGNRTIYSPRIYIDLLDDKSEVIESLSPHGDMALLPGQYGLLKTIPDLPVSDLPVSEIAIKETGAHDYLWQYDDIPLRNAPAKVSYSDSISEQDAIPVYPKADINYIDYPVENTLYGTDIGLEIQEIRVNHYSTYDEIFVDVLNNTGYDLENIMLTLCILDKNGNVLEHTLMNSSGIAESVPNGDVVTITSPHPWDTNRPLYYTVSIVRYEPLDTSIVGDTAYLPVTPQAVGNGVD